MLGASTLLFPSLGFGHGEMLVRGKLWSSFYRLLKREDVRCTLGVPQALYTVITMLVFVMFQIRRPSVC